MRKRIESKDLVQGFLSSGIKSGDVVLIRAGLGSVGKIVGGADAFIDALLTVVGDEGTIVSLAFTSATFLRKAKIEDAFDSKKKSYAGALPNAMILREDSFRSKHPMCSYVAIGRQAQYITEGHDASSPAYEPVRKIIELNGVNMLVGCVESSPGFTTTHLAEYDLGLLKLSIFSRFSSVYFKNDSGGYSLFRRKDPGLCSNSFYKFYSLYVKEGVLNTGYVGDAYSISAPAKDCYRIEKAALKKNKKFNICESKYCFTCNADRWDRVFYIPAYLGRMIYLKLKRKINLFS